MKKGNLKKITIMIIMAILLMNLSIVIYAATIEKTEIQCVDENMYNALRQALSGYIMIGDADNSTLKIRIPTTDIPNITEINLDNKEILDITGIEQLTYLTKVSLAKNQIENIDALTNLNNIVELNLNGNSNLGDKANSVLSSKTGITTLKLSNTGIKNINFISQLGALQVLEIANDSFNTLTSIEELNSLTKLDVSGNPSLRTIDSILKVTTLENLNISNTGINTLELDEENLIGIYNLRNLKELYVSGLDVDTLQPIVKTFYNEEHHQDEDENWIGDYEAYLKNLETLDISYINRNENSNATLPYFSELTYLEKLNKLYMQGNQLIDVSDLYQLETLKEVNLKENKISDLSGLANVETEVDENGIEHKVVNGYLKATSIDLSQNEIDDISIFGYIQNKQNITYLDLSRNHIYNTAYIENVGGTIKLQDQIINMPIYKKNIPIDQYILLLPIMQSAKNSTSKVYAANAEFQTSGCEMNSNSDYQSPNLYNVIINKQKTDEDKISITLYGGIADGTVINFIITEDSYSGIDSIICNDENLKNAIYGELSGKAEENDYLIVSKKIINVNHDVISRIDKLDLSNKNIYDLTGLENFDAVKDMDISKNTQITTIEQLQYCTSIEKLNASDTSLQNNISAIENMDYLNTLILNNIGMTNIRAINNLTKKLNDNDQELRLIELDLSSNQLKNINGVQNILTLRKISVTNNEIEELPNLTNLTNLERLTAYSNKIAKAPKVGNSSQLKYIFLSDNKLTDISELSSLSNIIELDLSNNLLDDSDIEEIKDVRISKTLKLAGNQITNVSKLRTSISSVSELDISRNLIEDVSIIDNRFSSNGTLLAKSQKIATILEQTENNIITLDLPQIFIAAKTSGSYFYTDSDFELTNCTLANNQITINISELGNNIVTVKIVGGKADNTIFSVVSPIIANISYNTTDWTKNNVTATISFANRNNVIMKNNGGNEHIFSANGEFTFEYVDEYGVEGKTIAKVTWIDKKAPTITGVVNNRTYEDSVTPVIRDDNQIKNITLTKDEQNIDNYLSGTAISESGRYILKATDLAGNETQVKFTIREKEVIEEQFTSEEYLIDNERNIVTNIDLKTKVRTFGNKISTTSDYTIKDKNGNELNEDDYVGTGCKIITSLGEYTIIVKGDLNGNGTIELNDLAQAQKIKLKIIAADSIKVLAADLNKNGQIDLNDLARLQKIKLGI